MSTPPSNPPARLAVLLRFDGVVHSSDLPVQSFARHLTKTLPDEDSRALIAGMRGFLEGKPALIPAGVDLTGAEDGYQLVETLAIAAGLTDPMIRAAHQASRVDLAASAWAVDESDGLDELIAAIGTDTDVCVLTEPGDPAPPTVLDQTGVRCDELVTMPIAAALDRVRHRVDTADPAGVLVVGTRWSGELADAAGAGCATAMVDRYRLGWGEPTLRSPQLRGLIGPITQWRDEWRGAPAMTR